VLVLEGNDTAKKIRTDRWVVRISDLESRSKQFAPSGVLPVISRF
jgi:hypothetical protein